MISSNLKDGSLGGKKGQQQTREAHRRTFEKRPFQTFSSKGNELKQNRETAFKVTWKNLSLLYFFTRSFTACFQQHDPNSSMLFQGRTNDMHPSKLMPSLAAQNVNNTKESEELEKCWTTREVLGWEKTDIWSQADISKHFWVSKLEYRLANCGLALA